MLPCSGAVRWQSPLHVRLLQDLGQLYPRLHVVGELFCHLLHVVLRGKFAHHSDIWDLGDNIWDLGDLLGGLDILITYINSFQEGLQVCTIGMHINNVNCE